MNDEQQNDRAAHYRRRAEAVRTSAETCTDAGNKAILLRLAQAYDDLARRSERGERFDDDPRE